MSEYAVQTAALLKETQLLREEIADLKRRLGLTSARSSKPPSSEGLRKRPAPKSLRPKGQKPSGGQAGHKGTTLKQTAHPDPVVTHEVATCAGAVKRPSRPRRA
jgi:transposase